MTRRDPASGAAAPTTLAVVGMVCLGLMAGLVVLAGGLAALRRGSHAADAVALAVMSGSVLAGGDGQPALEAGRVVADANGTQLVAVDLAGWPTAVLVHLHLVPTAGWGAGGLLPPVTLVAAARLEPP